MTVWKWIHGYADSTDSNCVGGNIVPEVRASLSVELHRKLKEEALARACTLSS